MGYMDQYKYWKEDAYFDDATKAELAAIEGNEAEIEDRFYKDLEFGTGGLRGVIGAGTNRMNIYTVRRATQGLANYILKQGTQAKGVAISYDCRRMSPEFADETALLYDTIFFSGGRIGCQIEMAPSDLDALVGVTFCDLTA